MNARSLPILFGAVLAAAPLAPALAAPSDELDDILTASGSDNEIRSGNQDMRNDKATKKVEVTDDKPSIIKVIQPKTLLKIGRVELQPMIGGLTNDPWVNRYLFGLSAAYHVTEIFAVEVHGFGSPNLGVNDQKAVTKDVISKNEVAPQINRLTGAATVNLSFSPLYGKLATLGQNSIVFDIYATAGGGIAYTLDDLTVTDGDDDEVSLRLDNQILPALTLGGGLRVQFSKLAGLRFEVRDLSYINASGQSDGVTLEVKNNLMLFGGVSFYLGGRSK